MTPLDTPIDEVRLQAYVDGELSPDEVRQIETHLVQSREARELVLALRDEDRLIADILLDRTPDLSPAVASRAPARGFALGVVPSVALISGVLAIITWAMETFVPSSVTWLNPIKWTGIYEMAFDMLFLIRDEAPQLVDLVLAVAATASVSGLLTLGLSLAVRHYAGTSTLGALFLVLAIGVGGEPAHALDLRDEESVRIGPSETVAENLMVSAETVLVEGVVDGNLFAFAERLVIKGEVRGNVYALVRVIEVDGIITGTLHSGSERAVIAGQIEGDLFVGCEVLTLRDEGVVGRDFTAICQEVTVDGSIGRDLFAGGDRIEVRGNVARDADIRGRRIQLFNGASFGSDVDIQIPEDEEAEIDPGTQIAGEFSQTILDHDFHDRDRENRWLTGGFYMRIGIVVTALFLVGMALRAVTPTIYGSRLETTGEFFRTLGFGIAATVGTPIVLALVLVTVVGIPIAIIGLLLYAIAFFVSGILVSALVGRTIVRSEHNSAAGFGVALAVGIAVLVICAVIPYLGGLVRYLILLTGMGLIVERALAWWRNDSDPGLTRFP